MTNYLACAPEQVIHVIARVILAVEYSVPRLRLARSFPLTLNCKHATKRGECHSNCLFLRQEINNVVAAQHEEALMNAFPNLRNCNASWLSSYIPFTHRVPFHIERGQGAGVDGND